MSNVTYPFRPEGTVSLSVSTTSANVALSGGGRVEAVRIANTGSVIAYVRFDSAAPTAVTTDMPILPSSVETFTLPVGAAYIAAITSASTTTLAITSGVGV